MRIATLLSVALFWTTVAGAQSTYTRTELGWQGALLANNRPTQGLGGLGGRYVFNFTSRLAADADFTFYPQYTEPIANRGGRQLTFFAGLKGGIRRSRFGIFGKARPGLRFFSSTFIAGDRPDIREPRTHFALDLGGVLEFYRRPHWTLRLDFGEILTRMGDHYDVRFYDSQGRPAGGVLAGARVASSFSLSAGVNYRFGAVRERTAEAPQWARLAAGVQYSLLSLTVFDGDYMHDKHGIGGWASYFLMRRLALDGAVSFYPQDSRTVGYQDGGTIAQTFLGVKMGVANARYGIFVKLRPGFMRFSKTITDFAAPDPRLWPIHQATQFAFDSGGVLELYFPRRTVLRFDLSDTTVRYKNTRIVTQQGSGTVPARTESAIQLSVGFGVRF